MYSPLLSNGDVDVGSLRRRKTNWQGWTPQFITTIAKQFLTTNSSYYTYSNKYMIKVSQKSDIELEEERKHETKKRDSNFKPMEPIKNFKRSCCVIALSVK